MPQTLLEWFQTGSLFVALLAALYGGIIKPYTYIHNLEARLDREQSEQNNKIAILTISIDNLQKDQDRLFKKLLGVYKLPDKYLSLANSIGGIK